MSNISKLTLFLAILALLGSVAVSSFAAVTVELEQLNDYDSVNHYATALKAGTNDVGILRVRVKKDDVDAVTWTELEVTYTGPILGDIGPDADLYKGGVLISRRNIGDTGTVKFPIGELPSTPNAYFPSITCSSGTATLS